MADDVEDVVAAMRLSRYVLVGHSMGGKVAQIVAARNTTPLSGLVLVAPAPPHAMPVPVEQRTGMLASYQTLGGVDQAIGVLAGRPLSAAERERVVADTLAGTPDAKRERTERGMVSAVDPSLRHFVGPVEIVVGEVDQVERPETLRDAFANVLPQAVVTLVAAAGHLLPIENPASIVSACRRVLNSLPS